MPIKKHIIKVEENNKIEIPKSICDALGIAPGVLLKVESDKNGYSFRTQVIPTFEMKMDLEKTHRDLEMQQAMYSELLIFTQMLTSKCHLNVGDTIYFKKDDITVEDKVMTINLAKKPNGEYCLQYVTNNQHKILEDEVI